MGDRERNLEAVQGIYEAFGRGDVEAILGVLADDVDFASEPDQDIAPWHGRRTKAEVPAFFQALGETIDVTEFTPLTFTTSDTDVQAVIRFGMTVRATGRSGVMDIHHWWRFRDGKVVQYRGTEDTALVATLLAGS
jgi:ketosteroid isomerase-like protein